MIHKMKYSINELLCFTTKLEKRIALLSDRNKPNVLG